MTIGAENPHSRLRYILLHQREHDQVHFVIVIVDLKARIKRREKIQEIQFVRRSRIRKSVTHRVPNTAGHEIGQFLSILDQTDDFATFVQQRLLGVLDYDF